MQRTTSPATPKIIALVISMLATGSCATTSAQQPARPRARDLGITIGEFEPGQHNAITDVDGVAVGHATRTDGDSIRTGVTVILPHDGDPFDQKVPAAVRVRNGYGKLAGATQVAELGELESPIALTNTLSVGRVVDALVEWTLEQPGHQQVRSVNCVVGETNDGWLNDIRGRHVTAADVRDAIGGAIRGAVTEGSVGAGTGTSCFDWKGGVGTSSRRVGDHVVGVLVQSNYGGTLTIDGRRADFTPPERGDHGDGSCMIVIATDAPLCARNLGRLAERAFAGMARTGASFSNGSGDYAIAFSTAESQRIHRAGASALAGGPVLRNDAMTPLFAAVADATEEAILNSILRATTIVGRDGHVRQAIPIARVRALLDRGR